MQEFYNAVQKDNESVTLWSIRLEEVYQTTKERGHGSDSQKDEMLKNKFWRGLRSTELKNATRVRFEKDNVGFEMLRTKVRAAEYELLQPKVVLYRTKMCHRKIRREKLNLLKRSPLRSKIRIQAVK